MAAVVKITLSREVTMYFFLTHNIDEKLAGLEIAVLNRIKIFNEMDVPAKILTFHYNRFLHMNTKKWSLADNNIINMFDYFQKSTSMSDDFNMVNISDKLVDNIIHSFGDRLTIEETSQYIFIKDEKEELLVSLERFNFDTNQISKVQWFDRFKNVVREDSYDVRGFLSISSFFGQDGGVTQDLIYDIDGNEVFNSYYHSKKESDIVENSALILKENKSEKIFSNLDQLTAYFYDLVSKQDDTFIADRSYLVDKPLFMMKNKVKKYEFWHNTFTQNYEVNGPLVDVMQQEINSGQLKGYLVPTKAAKNDLSKRLQKNIKVYDIPVALNIDRRAVKENRDKNKVILVARVEEQKNIADGLKAFQLMHSKIQDLRLYIYGYILDMKLNDQLHTLVKTLGIEEAVYFKNYTLNKDEIYQDAQLLIMTSRNEGWGMVINEAMTYGVPAVSYDTYYGPNEIITNGKDGYIVNQGDYVSLSQQSLKLIQNENLHTQFSKNGLEGMKRYNLANSVENWQKLLTMI